MSFLPSASRTTKAHYFKWYSTSFKSRARWWVSTTEALVTNISIFDQINSFIISPYLFQRQISLLLTVFLHSTWLSKIDEHSEIFQYLVSKIHIPILRQRQLRYIGLVCIIQRISFLIFDIIMMQKYLSDQESMWKYESKSWSRIEPKVKECGLFIG